MTTIPAAGAMPATLRTRSTPTSTLAEVQGLAARLAPLTGGTTVLTPVVEEAARAADRVRSLKDSPLQKLLRAIDGVVDEMGRQFRSAGLDKSDADAAMRRTRPMLKLKALTGGIGTAGVAVAVLGRDSYGPGGRPVALVAEVRLSPFIDLRV